MNTRNWIAEHDLQSVFTQMKKKMIPLKKTIASLTSSSNLGPKFVELQGFAQQNSLFTIPLVVTIPHVGHHSQSKPTIPKPRKTKSTKPPAITKKQKVEPVVPMVDLTIKRPQTTMASPIVQELAPSTSTVSLSSQDPSLHTTSTSTTLSYTIPSRKRLGMEVMEFYSVIQSVVTLPSGENITTSMISLLLELSPLLSTIPTTSQPMVTTIKPFVRPFFFNFHVVPNPFSIPTIPQFAEPSQQTTYQ